MNLDWIFDTETDQSIAIHMDWMMAIEITDPPSWAESRKEVITVKAYKQDGDRLAAVWSKTFRSINQAKEAAENALPGLMQTWGGTVPRADWEHFDHGAKAKYRGYLCHARSYSDVWTLEVIWAETGGVLIKEDRKFANRCQAMLFAEDEIDRVLSAAGLKSPTDIARQKEAEVVYGERDEWGMF